jgi:hypothetical protein
VSIEASDLNSITTGESSSSALTGAIVNVNAAASAAAMDKIRFTIIVNQPFKNKKIKLQ